MERQEAREALKDKLKEYVESITTKSKGANMYVCPLCHSGEGKSKTGAFSIKGNSWKCFSCNAGGDIFDLIGAVEGIVDHNEQLKRAGELYNINIDAYRSTAPEDFKEYQNQDKNEQNTDTHNNIHTSAYTQEETEKPYKTFFLEAEKHIQETDYPQRRGLTEATIKKYHLGYVAEWRHPDRPTAPPSPRLIIPVSMDSYFARDTREVITEAQKPYSKQNVGQKKIYNRKALTAASKPIFIVEGELDALSIIDVGGVAVALGSTTKTRAFIELCKVKRPIQPLIISMDNDIAGKKAQEELVKGLTELNIEHYVIDIYGDFKDANEALIAGRETFKTRVAEAEQIKSEAEQIKREEYLSKNSVAHNLQSFIDGIAESVNTTYIPTGFSNLDRVLDGGLYEGLYIVGAISSLGKTTLITQIADQIAESGKDVLIFSLEMARAEIMAKSISRHTLKTVIETGGDTRNAKTTRGITTASRYIDYNPTEKKLIQDAITTYGQYAEHLYISEGLGDIGAEQIRKTVAEHILYTGNTPLVIIDYLQILAPYNERSTDKQNTDKAVMELKRISRDYKTPVIGISSFNRDNYKNAVTMEAFKESGAIEYSSDVLIGLQLKGAGERDFDANEAKRKSPREIELVILKNRNGSTGEKLCFSYYPMFNYFKED